MLQVLLILISMGLAAKVDRVHLESYLGEKNLDSYSERYQPLIFQDIYKGKLSFADELFFQNFFASFLFQNEEEYSLFLKSELNGGLICPNELLSKHFDEIRFSYRLINLSYLLEGQWHNKLVSDHLGLKNSCHFDLKNWLKSCRPKTQEMKKFVTRLEHFLPRYTENLSPEYKKQHWWNEFKSDDFKLYSHYRMQTECKGNCTEEELSTRLKKVCENDEKIMTLICSELDEFYGMSEHRDAYYLLGQSNIINTYNQSGEAIGCLRRFSEVMAHKEVRLEVFKQLFPALQSFLREKYQERFLQGRVFFYGSGKEFEMKGLSDLYVKEQPLKIEKLKGETPVTPVVTKTRPVELPQKVEPIVETPKVVSALSPAKEMRAPVKSAFLIASEIRASQNLDRVEVDMMKLKYDYVFSLNMINTLSERLSTFMTREALTEMMDYDKLGTKQGPVPLLFIKYMIDMQEHHGLWNIISVLGDKFYVSNEIDSSFTPSPELIQLKNNQDTGNQWQIYIIKP